MQYCYFNFGWWHGIFVIGFGGVKMKIKNRKGKRYSKKEGTIIRENYLLLSYRELGELLHRSESSVRNRVYEMKLPNKRSKDYWTEAEIEWLVQQYQNSEGKKKINLEELSQKLGKLKSNVCRKAKEFGFTSSIRKHHTHETKEKISIASLGVKQNLTPEERERRSIRAKENIRKMMAEGNMYSRTKSGKREDVGGIYFRSSWEANYARVLNYQGIKWEYEPKEFSFGDTKRGARVYIPDFYLLETGEWMEVKGWLDNKSKDKLIKFRKYYPKEFNNLRIMISESGKKERKWADEIGIPKIEFYEELKRNFSKKIEGWE